LASAAVDHMVSLIVFMAAIMIFIGLFSQNMQTGINYERHSALSTKTSDLLDNIMLNPGLPQNWGQSDGSIAGFGLQDPDYSQYKLSSFSSMRLYSTQSPVYYNSASYSNITAEFGGYLIAPSSKSLNYSAASKLLGINGTYGFQLTLTPTITVSIEKLSVAPLKFSINVDGTGYPFANAPISYSLFLVNQNGNDYPSYTMTSGISTTDIAGYTLLTFPQIISEGQSYAIIVYSYLDGLRGVGYYVHNSAFNTKTVTPLVDSFQNGTILLVHGDSVGQYSQSHPATSQLNYNASFFILAEDYSLRQVQLGTQSTVGKLVYDSITEKDYASITLPNNDGILIIAYKSNSGQYGVALMPWGLGSLAFPLKFGGNPAGQEWVTTDIRQVMIGSIAYQAQLSLWNLQGYSGSG
jgi:hypothetical protein